MSALLCLIVAAAPLKVGVTLHPYYSWAAQVTKGLPVELVALVPGDVDIGSYQPRPQDVATLTTLDVLVENGLGHDAFLDEMVRAAGNETLTRVRLNEGTPLLRTHAGTAPNSHTFLSMGNAALQSYTLARALAQLRPEWRPTLERNTAAFAKRYAGHSRVRVGLAPHSARALTREGLARCAAFAKAGGMPLHSHVSEQRREVVECLAEHGLGPIELFGEVGALDPRFTGVHATHLREGEAGLLGKAGASVCICRTTERDLGDGFPDVRALRAAGVRLTVGTDSHASSDPFEEARAIELDERCRVEARHAALEAPDILEALTSNGYAAIGWSGPTSDRVILREDDPALALAGGDDALDDVVAFHASARAVRDVWVEGTRIVEDGHHPLFERARARYLSALGSLL